jgi:enediyne polyketide synthase
MSAVIPGLRLAVEVERNGDVERPARSDRLFQRALGESVPIARRPDGKPEVADRRGISAAHSRDWTVTVAGHGTIACDLEPVAARPAPQWRDLLGADRWELAGLIARESGEPLDVSATRAWVAGECLAKAGVVPTAPMVLMPSTAAPAVVLGSGSIRIATFVLPDRHTREPLVLGLLSRTDNGRL